MKVKVCDLSSNNFEKDLMDSILKTGFVVLTNHGISEELIRETQKGWRDFYLQEQVIKNFFINIKGTDLGYKPMKTETAVGAKKPDLKEFYHCRPESTIPGQAADSTRAMFSKLEDIGSRILRIIDGYNAKEGNVTQYEKDCRLSTNTILRTIYYPAMDFASEPDAVRAAAHEDINYITLLVAASAPGLQVLDKEGQWHDVPHEENSIVMNIGDMMQLHSKGKYKSTTHRVINPDNSKSDRISMPLFVHPHGETRLSPEKTAQQYLEERIAEIYGKK